MRTILTLLALGFLSIRSWGATPDPKLLVVFVHGFSGSELIERTGNIYTDFLPLRDRIVEKAKQNSRSVSFAVFKYDTRKYSNVAAGRALNLMLLGKIPLDKNYPSTNQLPEEFKNTTPDEVVFITISNGNLVVREAILQALGEIDPTITPKEPFFNRTFLRSPRLGVNPKLFYTIMREEKLISLYQRSTVFDVSPILAGSADARGAPFGRFSEINPFGKHENWLYSEKNASAYNHVIFQRHFTFFISGDMNTRGIWNFFTGNSRNPTWNFLQWFGSVMESPHWIRNNFNWLKNFERGRGVDEEHHFEYYPNFSADPYGNFQNAKEEMTSFLQSPLAQSEIKPLNEADDPLLYRQLQHRVLLKDRNYFAHPMDPVKDDFLLDDLTKAHAYEPNDYKNIVAGFNHPSPKDFTMPDRHTLLIFYKPLIHEIVERIFSKDELL